MSSLKSIKLNISIKLKDRSYRKEFFRGLSQDQVAQEIQKLRKKRGFSQTELAALIGTTQSAISRLEQAEYSKWSFNTLLNIADALDAQIGFELRPANEVIFHYEQLERETAQEIGSSRVTIHTGTVETADVNLKNLSSQNAQ